MKPSARLLEAFDLWSKYSYTLPADIYFRQETKHKRYMGSADRRAVRDLFYALIRRTPYLEGALDALLRCEKCEGYVAALTQGPLQSQTHKTVHQAQSRLLKKQADALVNTLLMQHKSSNKQDTPGDDRIATPCTLNETQRNRLMLFLFMKQYDPMLFSVCGDQTHAVPPPSYLEKKIIAQHQEARMSRAAQLNLPHYWLNTLEHLEDANHEESVRRALQPFLRDAFKNKEDGGATHLGQERYDVCDDTRVHMPCKNTSENVAPEKGFCEDARIAETFADENSPVPLEKHAFAWDQEAPLDVRVNTLKQSMRDAEKWLQDHRVPYAPMMFSPFGLRILNKENFDTLWIKQGLFEAQDEGSQLISLACDVTPSMRVLDMCAGAGGKTLALSLLMNGRGKIIASDPVQHRLKRARERLQRLDLHNVTCQYMDTSLAKRQHKGFDRVLVDAPCSGSGTWRRNPEMKHRIAAQDLEELVQKQRDILSQAAPLVKEGGRLIYATCSLLEAENNDQILWFLQNYPQFKLVPLNEKWTFIVKNAWHRHTQRYPADSMGQAHEIRVNEANTTRSSAEINLHRNRLSSRTLKSHAKDLKSEGPPQDASDGAIHEMCLNTVRAALSEKLPSNMYTFSLTPHIHKTDGFFVAVLECTKPSV